MTHHNMATQSQPSGFVEAAQTYLKDGAMIGAAAYVLNYVLVFLMAAIDGVEGTAEVATWKYAGWVFYGSHNVDLEVSAGGQSETSSVFGGTFTGENLTSTVPEIVYFVVPAVVLLGAGYMLYDRVGGTLDTESAAGLGATLAAGYVVLAAVGTVLFEVTSGPITVAPEMTNGVLIAGLAYPLVLGAIGAVAASES